MDRDTLIVIPTYNEASNIGALLGAVIAQFPSLDLLVVDDNSPDGTAHRVQEFASASEQVHLIRRRSKDGLARAYLTGFQWALEKGYERILQMDADLSHSPDDLNALLTGLNSHDAVVGCRYLSGGGIEGWGPLRQAISRGGNWYAQIALRLPYRDLTGGFNGWHRRVLKAIRFDSIASLGYSFQVELKYRAHTAGFKIQEIPIWFRNRRFGVSKMNGSIVLEATYRVWQIRWSARAPLYERAYNA